MDTKAASPPNPTRLNAALSLVGLVVFLGAAAFSAHAYPGGTYWDRDIGGASRGTFFCDLLRPLAHNGDDNGTGARAAQLALLALALGLGPFFRVVEAMLDLSGVRLALVLTGAYAGRIALILVAAGTGRLPPAIHDGAILLGGPLGLLALTLTVCWTWRLSRPIALTGSVGLGLGLWNLAQYVREAVLHAPSWPGLPLVQKAAMFGLLSFIALLSLRGLRHRASAP